MAKARHPDGATIVDDWNVVCLIIFVQLCHKCISC